MGASERDEFLRASWRALVAGEIDAKRLVFVDEMGSNTSLFSLYAWARLGERARCSAPRNRGKNTTLLASMSLEGMGPCVAVVGSTTAAVFEAYVKQALAPALRPGQVVVVMDNLGAHKGERVVRELIGEWGCEVLYLPPALLAGAQPHRGGVLQGQGCPAPKRREDPGGFGGGDGKSAGRGNGPRRPGFLGALWLPSTGPISVTTALGCQIVAGRHDVDDGVGGDVGEMLP